MIVVGYGEIEALRGFLGVIGNGFVRLVCARGCRLEGIDAHDHLGHRMRHNDDSTLSKCSLKILCSSENSRSSKGS